MNNYELRFFDPFGNLLFTFDIFIELEFGRQKNDVGACSLLIPGNVYDINLFKHDSFLEIWRYNDYTKSMELFGNTVYFLQKLEYSYNNGSEVIELVFYDSISLLKRRYNLWLLSELTDYPSHMNRPIIDQMIQLFNHNFGVNVTTKSDVMTISGPPGNDPPIAVQIIGADNRKMEYIQPMLIPNNINETLYNVELAWENCLETFQKLADLSAEQNVNVWFDVVYQPSDTLAGNFKFQIWENIRGSDFTFDNNRKIFGIEYGNFADLKYVLDYTEYANAVIAISDELVDSNEFFDEVLQSVALASNYNSLPFYPIEHVVEERKTADPDSLITVAQSTLFEKRPVRKVTGDIVNMPGYTFGVDFNYGDIVIVDVKGVTFAAEINKFNISVNRNGESISIPIESTMVI